MRPVLVECQVESVTVGGHLRSPQQSAVVVRRSRIHFDGPGNSRQPQISPHHVNLSYHAHTADLLRTPAPSTHQDRETLASEPPRCIVRSSNPGNCRLRSPADSGHPQPVGQRSAGRSRCRRDCAPRLARAKTTIRSTSSALFPFSSPNWIHAWAPRSGRAEVVSTVGQSWCRSTTIAIPAFVGRLRGMCSQRSEAGTRHQPEQLTGTGRQRRPRATRRIVVLWHATIMPIALHGKRRRREA